MNSPVHSIDTSAQERAAEQINPATSTPARETFIVPPCPGQYRVLYADQDCLLIDKPAGLLSVPGRDPRNRDSLLTRLRRDFGEIHAVHRLDRCTSGIMVLARHKQGLRCLSQQFQQRKVNKQYHACVDGIVRDDAGCIEAPLICDWPRRPLQKVCHDTGKAALTRFRVLQRCPATATSVLLLEPETGRSHQLRIHCREIGHPILGCEWYAHERAQVASNRLLLHASKLEISLPCSDERIVAVSAPPF